MISGSTRIGLLKEAFGLHNLAHNYTNPTTGLLEYGLEAGFIQRRLHDDRLTIKSINAYPMSIEQLGGYIVMEFITRLSIFIPATRFVKSAIDVENVNQNENTQLIYSLSIIFHQALNYDKIDVRTINRLLVCMTIIFFSFNTSPSSTCADMIKFKKRINNRLKIDYFLWTLSLAMDILLTLRSKMVIDLEAEGHLMHYCQLVITILCYFNLSSTMRMIGNSRLIPLIMGTPLLFLDVGDVVSVPKFCLLMLCYLVFWALDWCDLVDWNHSMLCDSGVCKVLSTEKGNLRHIMKQAEKKFIDWRFEEGLDFDGLFLLLDPPVVCVNRPSNPQRNNNQTNSNVDSDNVGPLEDDTNAPQGNDPNDGQVDTFIGQNALPDDNDDPIIVIGQQLRNRVIYLQSRNPILTFLAVVILAVWR